MVQSVRPSVCLSLKPFWLCSHHRIIMKFSGPNTNAKSDVHAKGQGLRSTVKVTEVNTQLSHFWIETPVWIHIWWWNDAQSLMLLKRGALLFFKVIWQIPKSHGTKNRRFWPKLSVSNYIFILDLIPGFNKLDKGHYKTRPETLKFWDLLCLILETRLCIHHQRRPQCADFM